MCFQRVTPLMSGSIQIQKTPRAALLERSDAMEHRRKRWASDEPKQAWLGDLDRDIAALCDYLHILDHDGAPKVKQRWSKLRSQWYPAIVWVNLIDALQQEFTSKQLKKLAGPVERLSHGSLEKVDRSLTKKEWGRTRRWWYGFTDSLAEDTGYIEVSDERLSKAHHRIIKTRDRALKKSADVTWHKLQEATQDIRLLVQLETAETTMEGDIELVSICHLVEANVMAWRLANDMASYINTLAKSSELNTENKFIERLNGFRYARENDAFRHLEVTRDLIAATAFSF